MFDRNHTIPDTGAGEDRAYGEILEELKSGKAQLIDIREKNEWQESHFACAEHIPLSELSQGRGIDRLREIKAGKKIYFHCRSGSRVRAARTLLAGFGCTEFTILPDSMSHLLKQGFKLL